MEVRFARKEDLEQVNAIRRMVNQLHVDGRPDIFKPNFCSELQQHLYEILDDENWAVIVAAEGETVCGMSIVQYVSRPESPYNLARRIYHVEEFGVDARFRRKGAAAMLVEFMKQDARDRDFAKIELDVWAFNEDAMAFYAHEGFQPYRTFLELVLQNSDL